MTNATLVKEMLANYMSMHMDIDNVSDEGLAYHFDDDPYDVLDDYALAGVIDFNTMQMRDYCEEHDIDSFEILVELTK